LAYIDEVRRKREEAAAKRQRDAELRESLNTTKTSGETVAKEVTRQAAKSRATTQKVKVENDNLAGKDDVGAVADAIHKLNLTAFIAQSGSFSGVIGDIARLAERSQSVLDEMERNNPEKIVKAFSDGVKAIQAAAKSIQNINVESDMDVIEGLSKINDTIASLKVNPTVNVPAAEVTVNEKEIDLSPLTDLLKSLEKAIKDNKVQIPDNSELRDDIQAISKAINNLRFPVPNYILPFKDANGKAVQVQLDSNGAVPTSGGGGGSGGDVNLAEVNGAVVNTGPGTAGTGTQRVSVSSDSTIIAVGNVADAATDSGNPVKIGGKYNATQPTYTDGQRGDLQLTARGNVRTELFGVNNAATVATAGADDLTNSFGALRVHSFGSVYDGSTWDRMRGDSTNGVLVDLGANNDVTATGNVAHDAVDSGNPIKTGGQARTTNPTAVADADRTNFIADKLGKQVVVGSIRDLKADQATTITSSTTETTIVTAVASTFCDLYGLIVTNTSATATEVVFRDVTAGTARFSIQVPAGDTRGFMLPESAAYKQATVNTAWTAQCSASVASIKINALYVKNI
jgi:hypothetical protein